MNFFSSARLNSGQKTKPGAYDFIGCQPFRQFCRKSIYDRQRIFSSKLVWWSKRSFWRFSIVQRYETYIATMCFCLKNAVVPVISAHLVSNSVKQSLLDSTNVFKAVTVATAVFRSSCEFWRILLHELTRSNISFQNNAYIPVSKSIICVCIPLALHLTSANSLGLLEMVTNAL